MKKAYKQKMLANWATRAPGTKASMAGQGGFTLIEIAIVLVIIGLLLGGVLRGQELINTARVRALSNTADGVTAAWFSFQDRYRAFPGDYAQASVNLPDTLVNGNGNGLVDTDVERANVWVHLEAAGYITGSFDGAGVAVDEYACPLTRCPDNGFGVGMNLSHTRQSGGTIGADAHELITGRAIPVEVLAELDRKIDDGRPFTGAMRLGIGSANGWSAAESGNCQRDGGTVNGVAVGIVYDITENISSNCAAVFRNF